MKLKTITLRLGPVCKALCNEVTLKNGEVRRSVVVVKEPVIDGRFNIKSAEDANVALMQLEAIYRNWYY